MSIAAAPTRLSPHFHWNILHNSTGRYLYDILATDLAGDYEVAFVWNRSADKMLEAVPQHLVLSDLRDVASMTPDLIVEVAHPSVVDQYGQTFLNTADFMVYTFFSCAHTSTRIKREHA